LKQKLTQPRKSHFKQKRM